MAAVDGGGTAQRGWLAALGRAALPLPLRRGLAQAGALLLPGECALCGGLADGQLICLACHRDYIEGRRRPCGTDSIESTAGAPARMAACAGGAGVDSGAAHVSSPVMRARCRVCANPLPAGSPALCAHCLSVPPAFDATVAVADYALPLDRLVLQLKFGGSLALARLFGDALADAALAAPGLVLPDVVCPVPLGPRRLRERGYNQALEMARPLARRLALPLQAQLAIRVRETAALARAATPEERRAHIAGAFAVPRRMAVEGRHVGLVDDVMTSGATMNELAALMKRYGATRVTCLVFARTPPHDE